MGIGQALKDSLKSTFLRRNTDVFHGLTPNELRKVSTQLRLSIGMPDKIEAGEAATKQFNALQQVDFLDSIDKEKAGKKEASDVKNGLNEILKLQPATVVAIDNFKARIDTINALIGDKKTPPNFSIVAVADKIHIAKSYAINAIKLQQISEMDALDALLKDTDFSTNAETAGFTPDQLKSQLTERHKQQIDEFEKQVNGELISIHKANQSEIQRILLVNEWFNTNKKIQADILEAIAKQQKNSPLTLANQVDINQDHAKFEGIKIADLPNIISLSGNTINKSKDGKSFSLNISTNRYGLLKNPQYRIQQDMRTLAQTVRACGNDTILFKINVPIREEEYKIKDEAHANLMARKAYTEALRSGFKHEDITINLNGTVYTGDKLLELFNEHPKDLQLAQNDAEEIQKIYAELKNPKINPKADPNDLNNLNVAFKEKFKDITNGKDDSPKPAETPIPPP